MTNNRIIIIGTEKTIQPSSSWWGAEDSSVFVVSAYGYSSRVAGKYKAEYFVESCSVVNSRSGCVNEFNPFKNSVDFEQDFLYEDICRFRFAESSVDKVHNSFLGSGFHLEGSEFAVAFTAYVSEQMGYSPWVVIQPDESNLIEFCKSRGWTFTVLGDAKCGISRSVQKIINDIVSTKTNAKIYQISSRDYFS